MQHKIERKINPGLAVVKEGWKGNTVIDGKFHDDATSKGISFSKVLKWRFSRKPQRKEKHNDTFRLRAHHFDASSMPENSMVWLGHASFLLNLNDIRLITDPSFFNLPSGKRKVTLPCPVDSLKPIHYLLISHDHRDHFDKKSVEALVGNNPDMEALIPLGGSQLFSGKRLSGVKKQEAGWFQEYNLTDGIRIVFLPAKHWGRRGLNDTNQTLWGSFLVIANHTKIFFAGDSAYDERLFREIRDLFGDMDICLLPIGAYSPQWFMSQAHVNPEEAVQIFSDLGGKRLIPMHYGTYDLSDEPPGEPIARLRKCSMDKYPDNPVKELMPGEEYLFPV